MTPTGPDRFVSTWLGRPEADERIFPGMDPSNYRSRHFAAVCKQAELGKRRPKDLRDTFASHLVTAGVQLAYISKQLGHADVGVTAKHYARWVGSIYRRPLEVLEGEVPADLLARLENRAHHVHTSHKAG